MNRKNLLSICCVCFFIVLALASKTAGKFAAFNDGNTVEDLSEKSNYLEKNDGSRIYGDKIKWKSGFLVKDQIQVDGDKYPISEIRGYREGDSYHVRYNGQYLRRIVHGKINIYVRYTQVTSTSTDRNGVMHTSSRTQIDHFAQKGEGAPLVLFFGQDAIRELVQDCPLAVQMISLTKKEMRKAVKNDRNYLNSVFDVYNNNCRAVN